MSKPDTMKLKNKAELKTVTQSMVNEASLSDLGAKRFSQELQLFQIELEMQNEELRRERDELSENKGQILRSETALRGLVNVIQCCPDTTQEFLELALSEAINLTESGLGYIYFYHEESKHFVLNSWSKDVMKECAIINPQTCYELDKTGIWGEAVRQRKPIIINDFQADHSLKKGYPEGHSHLTRFMTVPIFKRRKIVAVVGIANKKSDYNEENVLQLTLLMDSVWKFVDIKEGEDALLASEARYRRITEGLTDYLYMVHVENGHAVNTTQSPACEKVTGYTPEEFSANPYLWIEMVSPEDRDLVRDQVHQLLEGTDIPPMEHRIIRKDGAVRWVRDTTILFKDATGNLLSYDGMIQDITESKLAEGALRKSEALYRSLFENMLNGFAYCRILYEDEIPSDFIYLSVNNAFESMTGLSNVIGRKVTEVIPGIREADPQLFKIYGRVAMTGLPERFEMFIEALQMWFSISVYSPAPEHFVVLFDVITQRKQAEEEKIKLEAQLQQAQKMESVGRLAGGVAHDFNNLLTVIIGCTYLALAESDPTQPLYEFLISIQNAAEKSADLTQQLLAFARKQVIIPEVLDLNKTVEGMLKMLQRLIGEDIHITLQPETNLWPVKVDPSQIDQILANLCVNARDSIADVGKITIETGNVVIDENYSVGYLEVVPGDYVRFAVSDNGSGMDKETLLHIFEPFFTTKGIGEGTGLGLSTVYGAVKQNNGFINVYSEPDLGTTFTIYLPRHRDKVEQAVTDVAAKPLLRGQETILLVEDEQSIMDLTTMVLRKQGYTVLNGNTPGEALSLAREHSGEIKLLMTDVVMPKMNGRDLANSLMPLCPQLKILFMSGYTADIIGRHGVLDKGVHFIQKPFSLPDLTSKVREVLDGR